MKVYRLRPNCEAGLQHPSMMPERYAAHVVTAVCHDFTFEVKAPAGVVLTQGEKEDLEHLYRTTSGAY
jgi:hypothetical protein